MHQMWTAVQHDGPNHLGLWLIRRFAVVMAATAKDGRTGFEMAARKGHTVGRHLPAAPMENLYCSCAATGLQLQPLWRVPTAAVS